MNNSSNQQAYPYILQGSNIIIVIDNKTFTISKTHINYTNILDCIKTGNWSSIKDLIDIPSTIVKYSQGHIKVLDGEVLWKNTPFHNTLTVRILRMIEEGFNVKPMLNFMENLMQNPSSQSVEELYGFLEASNLPITSDGYFLAFKRVRDNYKDVHSGKIDNSVGQVVQMERNQVNDNRNETCSHGLHFCSREYLDHFGGERIMILKINPRDVVSIPSDYNDSKGRCCRYEVIGELEKSPDDAFKSSVDTEWDNLYPQDNELESSDSWGNEQGHEESSDDVVKQGRDAKGRFLPKNKV